jgi:hypothetical protein
MLLKTLLDKTTKADLQSYYLYWLPGRGMTSVKEELADDLLTTMIDQDVVRERFDALGRSHQFFLVSLLVREGYQGTVEDVRADRNGRQIEGFEVESVVRTLLGDGFVSKEAHTNGNGREEIFVIPHELGDAIRRTVSIESRDAIDMLSAERLIGSAILPAVLSEMSDAGSNGTGSSVAKRIESLQGSELRGAAMKALREEHGILTNARYAELSNGANGVFPSDWRQSLEDAKVGTTGVLNLRDFGIQFEEDALLVYQEFVRDDALMEASRLSGDNDVDLCLGTDFVIDLERFLELLRTENFEVTREGRIYKKTEERIGARLITSRHGEIFETSTVQFLLDVSKRLRFFDVEENRLVPIALRRRGWQKKSLFEKMKLLYEHFVQHHNGERWSFHQTRLREIFLEQLKTFRPGEWLEAPAFLTAVRAHYLLELESSGVRGDFQKRCEEDRHGARDGIGETIMVSLSRLQHDLSYWIVHRMLLLGLVEVGYKDEVLRAFRLSDLGQRFYGLTEWNENAPVGKPALINPDFEVLVFPGVSLEDEANLAFSRFADRQDSERVRRYRLTRDSVKRGVVCGMTGDEILGLLRQYSRTELPENVEFSVREWSDGVELVRRQKVLLLRSMSAEGMDHLVEMLEKREIPYERLTDTATTVRGSRNEKAIRDLRDEFRSVGLFIE